MRFIVPILILLCPCLVQANDSILTGLHAMAEKTHSISSSFTQEKHLAMFNEQLVSKGYFAFSRPSSLRWEYNQPFHSGFVIRDNEGMEWDEASGVRSFTLDSSPAMAMIARQIMAWTTFDIDWLNSRYDISLISASPLTIQLRPKSDVTREFLEHLTVSFSPDSATISSLELHETDGDFTRISFTGQRLNLTLPEDTFTVSQ